MKDIMRFKAVAQDIANTYNVSVGVDTQSLCARKLAKKLAKRKDNG